MFAIGDSVEAVGFGPGVVVDIGGAPRGLSTYRVARPEAGRAVALAVHSDEVEPGPALPKYAVGASVHVHAGEGTILARHGDAYEVEVVRPRPSGVVVRHRYPHVLPHEIALS